MTGKKKIYAIFGKNGIVPPQLTPQQAANTIREHVLVPTNFIPCLRSCMYNWRAYSSSTSNDIQTLKASEYCSAENTAKPMLPAGGETEMHTRKYG